MAKSRKRSMAAKKGWRRRRSRKANPVKRRRRRRTNVRRRRRRNSYARKYYNPKRKSSKRSAAARKGWRSRRARRANPVRRRRRRRNTWFKQPIRHRKASRRGWYGRRRGGSKYFKYRTSRGKKYKRPRKTRGRYSMWKNPKYAIRTRNPDGLKDIAIPVLLGAVGFLGSSFIISKIPDNIKTKLVVGGYNLAPVAIPIGVALALMTFGPKYMPQQSKMLYSVGFGLALAGAVAGLMQVLPANIKTQMGLAGYVTTPFAGYVRSPMSGYVLGQMEERIPRSLGAPVQYRGAQRPAIVPPTQRALAYQPLSVKPYGLGLPREQRRYNDFSWQGVYNSSTYE